MRHLCLAKVGWPRLAFWVCLAALLFPVFSSRAAEDVESAASKIMADLPKVDADALIKKSFAVLRDREPEMTETEFALYDRVVPLVEIQPDLALKLLQDMTADEDSSAAFELVLGNVYFEQKRYEDAEVHFRASIEKYPEFKRAWDNLGILYFTLGRFEDAVPCFAKVVSLGGWEGRVFGVLGYCLAQSKKPTAAELAYMQACVIDPDNSDWIEGLLQIYMESHEYGRAETMLRQLVRLEPDKGDNWFLLANVLVAQDRNLDAIASLDVANGLGVLPDEGLQLLGDLNMQAGFFPEAIAAYRHLSQAAPEVGVDRLLRFVRALTDSGKSDEAQNLLREVEPLVGESKRAAFLQARSACSLAQGDWEQARADLRAVLGREPLNGLALMDLARIEREHGDESREVSLLESAVRVPDVAYTASLQLAQLEAKRRHYTRALDLLEKALNIQSSPIVRDYYAQIKALSDQHD